MVNGRRSRLNGKPYTRTQFEILTEEEGGWDRVIDEYITNRRNLMPEKMSLSDALHCDRATLYLMERKARNGNEQLRDFFAEVREKEREETTGDRKKLVTAAEGNPIVQLKMFEKKNVYASQEYVTQQAIELSVRDNVQTVLVQVISMFANTLRAKLNGDKEKLTVDLTIETLVELFNTAQQKQVEENELNVIEA